MIRADVALAASARESRDRTELVCRVWQAVQVPIVPSALGLPMLWHCSHPLVMADATFQLHKRMRCPPCPRLADKFPRSSLAPESGLSPHKWRPMRGRMPAAQELLIDVFVAAAAVGGGQVAFGDDESVMILLFPAPAAA